MEEGYTPCPLCAEPIRIAAIKCRHCGSDIRENAVASFVEGGESTHAPAEPVPAATIEVGSESSQAAIATGRLSLGVMGHYIFIPAVFVLFAGAAEVGSGLKAIGAIVLAVAYGMIGFGWLGMRTKRSNLHFMCSIACFLAALGLVGFAFSGAPVGTQHAGLNSALKGVFGAHAFYMLALGVWYHAGGVKSVIAFRGLTETSALIVTNSLVYTCLTYLVFVSILITSFATKSDVRQISQVVALLGGVICMFRPINHFKAMRRSLEEPATPPPFE